MALKVVTLRVEHNNIWQSPCLTFFEWVFGLMFLVFCRGTPQERMIPYLADFCQLLAWCGLPVCQLTILVAGVACQRTVFGSCFFFGKRLFFDDRFLGPIFSPKGVKPNCALVYIGSTHCASRFCARNLGTSFGPPTKQALAGTAA